MPASPSTAFAAGLPDSAVVALAVPASAQFTVGADPPPPSAATPPAPRAAPPSGRAWATVPVAATTASGAASTNAQAAATSRGRRPAASAAVHLVRIPGSSDFSIKFPFEPTRPWPQVDIFTRVPTTGNRLPYGFQQKITTERPRRVPPLRPRALPPASPVPSRPHPWCPAPRRGLFVWRGCHVHAAPAQRRLAVCPGGGVARARNRVFRSASVSPGPGRRRLRRAPGAPGAPGLLPGSRDPRSSAHCPARPGTYCMVAWVMQPWRHGCGNHVVWPGTGGAAGTEALPCHAVLHHAEQAQATRSPATRGRHPRRRAPVRRGTAVTEALPASRAPLHGGGKLSSSDKTARRGDPSSVLVVIATKADKGS